VKRAGLIFLVLLLPYAAMLWVPSYDRAASEIAGIPFFYWYQLLWIPLGSLLLLLAHSLARRSNQNGPQ
jgi:TRAP-type C4-dicarboxylate transport system permease small subunit